MRSYKGFFCHGPFYKNISTNKSLTGKIENVSSGSTLSLVKAHFGLKQKKNTPSEEEDVFQWNTPPLVHVGRAGPGLVPLPGRTVGSIG